MARGGGREWAVVVLGRADGEEGTRDRGGDEKIFPRRKRTERDAEKKQGAVAHIFIRPSFPSLPPANKPTEKCPSLRRAEDIAVVPRPQKQVDIGAWGEGKRRGCPDSETLAHYYCLSGTKRVGGVWWKKSAPEFLGIIGGGGDKNKQSNK